MRRSVINKNKSARTYPDPTSFSEHELNKAYEVYCKCVEGKINIKRARGQNSLEFQAIKQALELPDESVRILKVASEFKYNLSKKGLA